MDANNQEQDASQTIDVRVSPVEPVEAPAEETTSQAQAVSIVPTVEAAGDPPVSESAGPTHNGEPQNNTPVSTPPPNEHKPGAPIGVIVAAVFVAIGLAAVTVYAYLQSQDKTDKTAETSQTTTTSPQVTEADVNQAETDVDEALTSTEEADFPDSELTDQSLGL